MAMHRSRRWTLQSPATNTLVCKALSAAASQPLLPTGLPRCAVVHHDHTPLNARQRQTKAPKDKVVYHNCGVTRGAGVLAVTVRHLLLQLGAYSACLHMRTINALTLSRRAAIVAGGPGVPVPRRHFAMCV